MDEISQEDEAIVCRMIIYFGSGLVLLWLSGLAAGWYFL